MISGLPESLVADFVAGRGAMKMTVQVGRSRTIGEGRLVSSARSVVANRDSLLPWMIAHPSYNKVDGLGPTDTATSSGSSGSEPVCHPGFGLCLAFELCHLSLDAAPHNNNVDYSGPCGILHGEGVGRSWAISDTSNTCVWGGAKNQSIPFHAGNRA